MPRTLSAVSRGLFDMLDQPDPPLSAMTIASGSSGNCTFVQAGSAKLLIDAGVPTRRVEQALAEIGESLESITGIVITHAHNDHIGSLPLLWKRTRATVYGTRPTLRAAHRLCGEELTHRTVRIKANAPQAVGPVEIHPVTISHDAHGSMGMMLEAGGRRLVVLTDVGRVDDNIRRLVRGADAVIVETNHDRQMLADGPYPDFLKRRVAGNRGHLSNDDAAELVASSASRRLRKVVCAHLSAENNHPDLAREAMLKALQTRREFTGVDVQVAPRATPSGLFRV